MTSTAFALPQFSTQFKQSCRLCHVNPTGGGMRNLYGAQFFSHMDLPLKPAEDFTAIEGVQPMLSDNVQIGVDFRSLYYTLEQDSSGNSFLTMQGDVYLAFMPTDRSAVYLDRSISGVDELYALLQGIHQFGAIRVGKFLPAYGWRFDEHKLFVRDRLGFGALSRRPIVPDNGVEIGWYPMEWEWSLALTNGTTGFYDADEGKAITTRGAYRFSTFDTNLTLGASYHYGELGRQNPLQRFGGGFWGANWKQFTYLSEVDWMVENVTGLVTTQLFSYRLQRGVDINFTYDFHDPDVDLKSGSAWRSRLSANLYLTGYLELIPAFEMDSEEIAGVTKDYSSGELQLHVWF